MNFSYGSHAVTLVSLCVPLVSQKNKQNNLKMNLNGKKTKNFSEPASQFDWEAFKLQKKNYTLKSEINS